MRILEILVEEPSAEVFLKILLPKIIGDRKCHFKIITHQGKGDLVRKLPQKLRAYKKSIAPRHKLIILIDRDSDDCAKLKLQLENFAREAGFITKTQAVGNDFQVLNRIAIEEIEAWFLGDEPAVMTAFPKIKSFSKNEKFRNPDNVRGGTWEMLEKLLQGAGYYRSGMPKLDVARKIAIHMNPSQNRSRSFQVFKEGIEICLL